jgi:hypothetical protein
MPISARKFIVAVFIIAPKCKQPKYSLNNEND